MVSHPAKLPISVVIVARNEVENLPRCLSSVSGWVAEIVVALNATTDASEEVAASQGAIIHQLPWTGFRDTKNAAVALASHDWILALDADEEISPELRHHIQELFLNLGPHIAAQFPRKVWFLGRWILHGDWYPDMSLRLFHRSYGRWGGDAIVHEKVEVTGPVATLRGDLHHYSFPTLNSQVEKITPFADLFLRQRLAKGVKFSIVAGIFRPLWRFFRGYIIKRGFLDGYPGLYIAVSNAFGTFVRYTRLYEEEHATPPPRS